MTICDMCTEHVSRRYRNYVPLVNYTRGQLRQFSTTDLETMLKEATEGKMVCTDCLKMCRAGYQQECNAQQKSDFGLGKRTSHRMHEDNRMIEHVNAELQRRRNLANFRVQNNMLPSVPKTVPRYY